MLLDVRPITALYKPDVLNLFCATGPLESLVNLQNLSQKNVFKCIKYNTQMQNLYLCTAIYITDCITKETNYAHMQLSDYLKVTNM
jgi:hypothetical protein